MKLYLIQHGLALPKEKDPERPLSDAVEKLPEEILASNKDIMIIGHLPFLQKLAGHLLTGSEESEIIAFRNSGVVSLAYDEKWKIDWLVSLEHR